MDVESLVAIDVHTHAEVSAKGTASLADELHDASSAYFKVEGDRKPTLVNRCLAWLCGWVLNRVTAWRIRSNRGCGYGKKIGEDEKCNENAMQMANA
ncbi:MAG: hypothetical protein ACJ786_11525, partial [Catenulispora sp.]